MDATAFRSHLLALPQRLLLGLVAIYRLFFKAWLGSRCRFEPSCSSYAEQALLSHGAARGAALAGWRLARCHPFCAGGHDPVPETTGPARPGLFTRFFRTP